MTFLNLIRVVVLLFPALFISFWIGEMGFGSLAKFVGVVVWVLCCVVFDFYLAHSGDS